MTILLDPPKPDSPSFEIDHQIAISLAALHRYQIKIRGVGRFGRNHATVLLQRDDDCDKALHALEDVGIHAVIEAEAQRVRQFSQRN
ncbi:MAG TPA: hypothetical protein VKR29_06665 [Candidatus Binataceae bacterium]|jgi:hypothetical protein|nr:hypothetical protein [Candidatus Binataceae bacterium]